MSTPKVSIITITFNQEKYISQALDSFVAQKVDFEFEVIVADDCSTDNTPAIIEEYKKKHPKLFKPLLRKKNIGPWKNFRDALVSAKGEYVALCEGDDYWIDPNKLQKQINFLDTHPEYALCFHPVRVTFEDKSQEDSIFPDSSRTDFTVEELLQTNFIQTNSVVYRRQSYSALPVDIMPGDWYLHLYHARFGKVGFISEVMSIYRRHAGGIWWDSQHEDEKIGLRYGVPQLGMFAEVLKLYAANEVHQEIVQQLIDNTFNMLIGLDSKHATSLFEAAIKKYPDNAETFALRQNKEIAKLSAQLQARDQHIINLEEIVTHHKTTKEIEAEVEALAAHNEALVNHSQTLAAHNEALVNSLSWKVTKPLRLSSKVGKKTVGTIRSSAKVIKHKQNTRSIVRSYHEKNVPLNKLKRQSEVKLAVVVHLYYTEAWTEIENRLKNLEKETDFDLFVTIPPQNQPFRDSIQAAYPQAQILVVPNRGRDVLPFMKLAPVLSKLGYQFFLKLHSKRSPHRLDGVEWFQEILNNLIPQDREALREIMANLSSQDTGIIGPLNQYVSLKVNYESNRQKLLATLTSVEGESVTKEVDESNIKYGFIAGTMFWGRFDCFNKLLEVGYDERQFDTEAGQIDGTLAHALERAFSVIPEVHNKKMYGIHDDAITPIAYDEGGIPDWSDVYIAPKR